MVLTLSPRGTDLFRESTKKQIPVGAQKRCKGECKKHRSIRQFAAGSELCLQCVRRTPKPVVLLPDAGDEQTLPVNNTMTSSAGNGFDDEQTMGGA